ncbi:hypothetical protein PAXRUDRAFT_822857 [Paxillus rubicundulus Ve08.2h10]|uniref:Unplaced genomic scaffold scaffold_41, whole genome shotgun sequence n=1 Tax=Paxillus rubicundulus Ve08.2h10 TaxID=930991 RepID=A0A0D0E9D5_9AGAM|nr:hypothetical protein PAXRUDRAFT_822857 [Paxillus rubicundulus Ve08.2h10]
MANLPSTLKPVHTAVALVEMAVAKHNTRYDKTFLKAVLAGVMLSFGGFFDVVLAGGSPSLNTSNPGLVKVLSGFVFPVGLVMIVLQNLDLLTSNLMIFPMAAIKRAIPWWGVLLNWIIVFFGNLVGSLFFAAVLAKSDGLVTVDPYLTYVRNLAVSKAVTPSWDQILLRGVGCNWLVCVAIWQSTAASETFSKVIATWFPVWVFVACGYDHVVANMFSLPLGIMLHANLTTVDYIKKSLIASLIGNIIGGLFVGLPAVYFYLDDWKAGGLLDAEEAQAEKASDTSSQGK